MIRSKRLLFLRHAQATHNVDAWNRGQVAYFDPIHTDAPLTDTGHEQAHNTVIHGVPVNRIYCSPLRRCRQTLVGVMPEATRKSVVLDDRLMEPQGSHFCNRRAAAATLRTEIPDTWDMTAVAADDPWVHESSGWETFYTRVRSFTEECVRQDSERVLVVTHHEWIRVWFMLYAKKEVSPRNCELMWADIEVNDVEKGDEGRFEVLATSGTS